MTKRDSAIREFKNLATLELLTTGQVSLSEVRDVVPAAKIQELQRKAAEEGVPIEAAFDFALALMAREFDVPLARSKAENIRAHGMTVPPGTRITPKIGSPN